MGAFPTKQNFHIMRALANRFQGRGSSWEHPASLFKKYRSATRGVGPSSWKTSFTARGVNPAPPYKIQQFSYISASPQPHHLILKYHPSLSLI